MVDSEKLSLCCSDEGRYLLLGVGRWREVRGRRGGEGVEMKMGERWRKRNMICGGSRGEKSWKVREERVGGEVR